jgi:hypothetical protein
MPGADRPTRSLPGLVAVAGRGIFSRLDLGVRPNIESYTVRLPVFRHHGWASSPGCQRFYAAASATMDHSNCETIALIPFCSARVLIGGRASYAYRHHL